MEGSDLIKNILRNIVTEVLRECKNYNIQIEEGFISYYISLLVLDPNRELTPENLTKREKVQQFVRQLVVRFAHRKDPQIITLKLQYEFNTAFASLENAVYRFRNTLDLQLYPLLLEIIEQSNRNTRELLYKNITYYVILASGLGNPSDRPVFKEAMQVMKSVLDPEEMEVFPSLQNYIKQELVKCLVDITTGIRLYNKSCKRGGEGIADLPGLMESGIKAVKRKLEDCIDQAVYRAKLVTRFVERHMVIKRTKEEGVVELDFKTVEEHERWCFMRDMATTYRQLSKTTRLLLEYISNMEKNIIHLNEEYTNITKTLDSIIVPTLYQAITEVFPHFTDLAKIWKQFQDEAVLLKEISNIYRTQTARIFSMEFNAGLENEPPYMEQWIEAQDEELQINTDTKDLIVHTDTERFTKKDLEFHGYCCWMLTHTDGVLVPGLVRLGVIEYRDKFYAFSSRMAANCFMEKPEEYILKTIELARQRVHLIKFLDLEEALKKNVKIKVLVKKQDKPKITVTNAEVQTDTHFQEAASNYKYFWNIWDYKRVLLGARDLMTKTTKSTETDKTHQRESQHTQTYDMKSSETQTKRENYSNTVRPLRYFYGLRGSRKNYPFVMDLSEPQSCTKVPKVFLNKSYKN